MTHINPTCPHATKVNESSPRRAAFNWNRRHGALLAYDGVTAAYIRDISSRSRFVSVAESGNDSSQFMRERSLVPTEPRP
jgi:hypothetical protein